MICHPLAGDGATLCCLIQRRLDRQSEFDLGERLLDGFLCLPIAFCRAFPDQVGADNEALTKSTTVEKSDGDGVRDHKRA